MSDKLVIAVVALVVIPLISIISAVPVMVGASVAHGYWAGFPDFSFWESFWLLWAWGTIWNRVKFSAE